MAMFTRAKRVSGPLNENVRAQLLHGVATPNSDDLSSFLPTLIHGFFDLGHDDNQQLPQDVEDSTTSSESNNDDSATTAALETLHDLDLSSDPFGLHLHSDVIRIADTHSDTNSIMSQLREIGYNAGVCKTKWESSGGLTAGNYKYIDVVNERRGEKVRYIVDMEFREQFELARVTEEYERVMEAVPRFVVGREEVVRRAVKVMAEAAKRSMKRREMSVPPWRKRRYLLSKWFGPCKRIVSSNNSLSGYRIGGENIKCRSVVGFGVADGEKMKRGVLV